MLETVNCGPNTEYISNINPACMMLHSKVKDAPLHVVGKGLLVVPGYTYSLKWLMMKNDDVGLKLLSYY